MTVITRWQQFYLEDTRTLTVPPSAGAAQASHLFQQYAKQVVLEVGCGTGRDTRLLAESGLWVVGLDAARSGLQVAQAHETAAAGHLSYVEADARFIPFGNQMVEGIYSFGLLHEFVGETGAIYVTQVMREIHRVLQPHGLLVLAVLAGEPDQGLPHVQLFSEAMLDQATARFVPLEKSLRCDRGCTGRQGYQVWFGVYQKADVPIKAGNEV